MNADCVVLVTSCDAYRDIDGPFIRLWRRFWPDCPFEVVLLTETAYDGVCGDARFDRVIAVGKGKTWSQTVVEALGQLDCPYVILQMNDFIPDKPVNTARMLELLEIAKRENALSLRLIPKPFGGEPYAKYPGLRVYPKNRAYSASCQTGYWNREYLRSVAKRTKSAWEFERYGSYMFDLADPRPLLMTETQEFPCLDTVKKGYWMPFGVKLLMDEKIDYDFSVRGPQPPLVRVKEWIKKIVFNLNPEIVTRIQNVFNAGKH